MLVYMVANACYITARKFITHQKQRLYDGGFVILYHNRGWENKAKYGLGSPHKWWHILNDEIMKMSLVYTIYPNWLWIKNKLLTSLCRRGRSVVVSLCAYRHCKTYMMIVHLSDEWKPYSIYNASHLYTELRLWWLSCWKHYTNLNKIYNKKVGTLCISKAAIFILGIYDYNCCVWIQNSEVPTSTSWRSLVLNGWYSGVYLAESIQKQ